MNIAQFFFPVYFLCYLVKSCCIVKIFDNFQKPTEKCPRLNSLVTQKTCNSKIKRNYSRLQKLFRTNPTVCQIQRIANKTFKGERKNLGAIQGTRNPSTVPVEDLTSLLPSLNSTKVPVENLPTSLPSLKLVGQEVSTVEKKTSTVPVEDLPTSLPFPDGREVSIVEKEKQNKIENNDTKSKHNLSQRYVQFKTKPEQTWYSCQNYQSSK